MPTGSLGYLFGRADCSPWSAQAFCQSNPTRCQRPAGSRRTSHEPWLEYSLGQSIRGQSMGFLFQRQLQTAAQSPQQPALLLWRREGSMFRLRRVLTLSARARIELRTVLTTSIRLHFSTLALVLKYIIQPFESSFVHRILLQEGINQIKLKNSWIPIYIDTLIIMEGCLWANLYGIAPALQFSLCLAHAPARKHHTSSSNTLLHSQIKISRISSISSGPMV